MKKVIAVAVVSLFLGIGTVQAQSTIAVLDGNWILYWLCGW